jgi:hypothetical protein
MEIHNNYWRKLGTLLIGGIMMAFGLSGNAVGGCLEDPLAIGTLIVDATTECANIGQNGCRVDGDSGTCSFFDDDGNNETVVTVSPQSGGGFTWSVEGPFAANTVQGGGATQGGACTWIYEPPQVASPATLGFRKSNDSLAKVSYVEVCSKLETPEANLVVTKTATADGVCASGVNSLEIIIDRDPAEGETVTYCYEVRNTGTGDAYDVVLNDDNAGIGSSYSVTIGTLAAGATFTDDNNDVIFSGRGTFTNTATVTGTSESGTDLSVSAQATVIAGIAAAECPESYQALIDSLQTEDPDNAYAASILLQPQNPGLISLCTPKCEASDQDCIVPSTRTLCEDDCIWDATTGACQLSGVWDPINGKVIDGATRLPYCHEVVESIKSSGGVGLTFTTTQTVEIIELSVNPYVYQTCYKSGGRKVCETICYKFPGETDADCPAGSTIAN